MMAYAQKRPRKSIKSESPQLVWRQSEFRTVRGKKRRRVGQSCHQCKIKYGEPTDLHHCVSYKVQNKIDKNGKKTICKKKYCPQCMDQIYQGRFDNDIAIGMFVCPACLSQCSCAACRRKAANERLKKDGIDPEQILGNGKTLTPYIEVAQKGGTDEQAKQSSNLLNVLRDKPEARRLIREAMEVEFGNPHSKILYVAHIIRQSLRLDVDGQHQQEAMMAAVPITTGIISGPVPPPPMLSTLPQPGIVKTQP